MYVHECKYSHSQGLQCVLRCGYSHPSQAIVTDEAAAMIATHEIEDGGLLAGGQGRHFPDDGTNQRFLQML